MIAHLSGIFADFGPDWAVIEVGGVGYLVHCSAKTLAGLGTRGDAVTVHTQLQVSENDMRLIGFSSAGEREWFRLLTGVQGVGSKMALAVLSALSAEELQRACAGGDAAMVARSQGWGLAGGVGRGGDCASASGVSQRGCRLGTAEPWLQAECRDRRSGAGAGGAG